MGIRDKPIAPRSPWQNGFAERMIGSIRRECVDHIVVLSEAHLRRGIVPVDVELEGAALLALSL
jgi:transposase InsO family protein